MTATEQPSDALIRYSKPDTGEYPQLVGSGILNVLHDSPLWPKTRPELSTEFFCIDTKPHFFVRNSLQAILMTHGKIHP